MHTCIHPSIHASMHPCIHACIHPSIHPSIHPYTHIHTYTHTHIHAYMHTCIYVYIMFFILSRVELFCYNTKHPQMSLGTCGCPGRDAIGSHGSDEAFKHQKQLDFTTKTTNIWDSPQRRSVEFICLEEGSSRKRGYNHHVPK